MVLLRWLQSDTKLICVHVHILVEIYALSTLSCRKRTASRPNLQDVPVSPCVAYQLAEYPATNDSRIEEHNYKEIQSSNLPPYTGNRLASETPPYERLDRFPSSAGVHAPKIQNTNLKC